jgi:sugar (pentulose or hexulose) kinase
MKALAIDIGTSSVKACLLKGTRIASAVVRAAFPTRREGAQVDVEADAIDRAVASCLRELGAIDVEIVHLSVMAPSWLAMDGRGRALTRIVTHQDRRSVEQAREIERRVGAKRHLSIVANRPFPGGISSTSLLWHLQHAPGAMKRVKLVGHLSTYLIRRLTGRAVIDPSNASFTGLYDTLRAKWSDELIDAIGIDADILPELNDADAVVGAVSPEGSAIYGIRAGTPITAGIMDGSCAMLLAGPKPGQMVNVVGSTDVLAVCTKRPRPAPDVLTRALGVGGWFVVVDTIAAAGSAIDWAGRELFADLSTEAFHRRVVRASRLKPDPSLVFDPALAGSRTNVEPVRGSLVGLTLATTRDELLVSMLDQLARSSAARLERLRIASRTQLLDEVLLAGGAEKLARRVFHRDWPGRMAFRSDPDATLRGLGVLGSWRESSAR